MAPGSYFKVCLGVFKKLELPTKLHLEITIKSSLNYKVL